MSAAPATKPLVHMRGITKAFPGVQALGGIDLDLEAGEVLALVGENGAGKSTLTKILAGALAADSGTVEVLGWSRPLASPADARRAGIAVIYQEFNLVPGLSARENIFLGQEGPSGGFLNHREERRRCRLLLEEVGLEADPDTLCRRLAVAQQQLVEIARALATEARVLVMDEPSATLTEQEVERLFSIIQRLKGRGLGVIYISHRLEEIFRIADRVMVLRGGEQVATRPVASFSRDELIELMVGRKLEREFPPRRRRPGRERLRVRDLARGNVVRGVSFSLREGEIVGLTGLVGAGRTETVRLVAAVDRPDAGTVELDGRRLELRSPRQAIRHGICLLSEDRKAEGLVLGQTVRENFSLPNLERFSRFGFVSRRREARALERFARSLRIKTASPEVPARNLSGGNQQKVVLAKWLERNCDVLIFDEPTRGIDVGAKYEIYVLMSELAAQGKAILMVSSELPEVLGMSDRILVMHAGRITGEITEVAPATQEDVLRLAVGRSESEARDTREGQPSDRRDP